MDCHDNHRYHPYAPADGPHERYVGREWYRRDHAPFPSGHRGARNGRYSSGRRGTGSQRLAGREEMYRPPQDHRSVRPVERHLDSRYERPQRRISPPWYQGRSMHYGPPRPPFGNNRVHYRAAGYSPHPRVHPKSMRPASSHPTGLVLSFKKIVMTGLKSTRTRTFISFGIIFISFGLNFLFILFNLVDNEPPQKLPSINFFSMCISTLNFEL